MSTSFVSLGVPRDLAESLSSRGIAAPYPIQAATLPEALRGDDVCAQSPTGSGKTLAFGIPLIARVGPGRPHRPSALVLAPTRELAAQIAEELSLLGKVRGRRVATFYGGVGFGKQLEALRRGVDVAVACPGRLEDLLQRGSIKLDEIEIVAVDEADRMSDMGFMPVVRRLLDEIGPNRQTLFFSATLQGDVERLIARYERAPKRHVLDTPADEVGSRSHHFWQTDSADRARLTAQIAGSHSSTIVFCRTKRGVDRLTRQLTQAGITAAPIHGDRSQVQRDRALAAFHARQVQVLVGTDVASRGIHVDDVGCVVHFDPPEDESTYLHRSGRTGRAGGIGVVVSLVTREQEGTIRKFQKTLGMPVRFDVRSESGAPRATGTQPAARLVHTPVSSAPHARNRDVGRRRNRRGPKPNGSSRTSGSRAR